MLVCDDFLFLHLHKSGGTFINQMMLRCIPSARQIGYHLPYREAPDRFRHLPVLGTVRNPWSYYVSWYHFQLQQKKPGALYLVCGHHGQGDFFSTIDNLVHLHQRDDLVDRLAAAFPDHFVLHGLNLTKSCIRPISGSGRGFFSFLYDRLYAGAANPFIARQENLRAEVGTFVEQHCGKKFPLIDAFLRNAPPLNATMHADYRSYFDTRLKLLVEKADERLISHYSYAF